MAPAGTAADPDRPLPPPGSGTGAKDAADGHMGKPGNFDNPPIDAVCPACGFVNPPGFRFCGSCGTRIAPVEGAAAAPGRGRIAAERRQLTVLFCDLVGSTPLAASLELEELRDVIRSYQAVCADVVRRYGGTVSRFMGDGILVLFGYPSAHEDDPERAVRAGLAMVAAVARLGPPPRMKDPLSVRVGIATGLVVAGDLIGEGPSEEEAILGETPNLAARLQSAASPGNVVIGAATHALLGGRFLCEDLGPRHFKGFPEPAQHWRVIAPRSVASHFKAGSAGRHPLVGREEEVDWLLDLWRSAAARHGRVATLAGEAGIGKSRVAEAVRERLGEACRPLRYQCSPHYVNRALHPVAQHIERAARIGDEDLPSVKLEKLAAWLKPAASNPRVLAVLAALLSIPPEAAPALPAMSPQRQKQDTFDTLRRILKAEAADRPLLVIFEDLHWADPTTLEFLGTVVEGIDELSALVILTHRSGFEAPWARAGIEGRELGRLPRGPALNLAEQVAAEGGMPREVVEQVVARADGIPLFIEELTRAVLGLLGGAQGGPAVAVARALSIPSTLQDSLMARLDQLGPSKLVAQLASAIGREFGYPLLAAIAPLPAEQLRADLAALEEAGLVHAKDGAVGEVFAFKHALVQEVAYQTLLRSRRQELHAKVASVLEEQFPRQANDAPELLAHHWTEAGDVLRAVRGWLAAGERAAERSEYNEAVGHLSKGLELVPALGDPVRRRDLELSLLLSLGPVQMMVTGAGTPEVARFYARALEICRDTPKSGLHFAARWGRWRAAMDRKAGLERADDLLRLAEELGDPAHLVQAHHTQWATLYMLGAHEECCRHADEGIRLYDPERHRLHAHLYGGHDPKVCALGERALSCWLIGRLDEARSSVAMSRAWADTLGHVGSRLHAMDYGVQIHRLARDPVAAARQAEEMIAYADEQRLGEHRAKGMLFHGWARALADDPEGGLREAREGLALEEELGTPEELPLYYEMFAEVCERAGAHDEGLEAVAKGLVLAESGRLLFWDAELHRRRGELLRFSGAPVEAVAADFERALDEARGQGASLLALRAASSLVRLRLDQGDARGAGARLRAACARFSPGIDAPDLRTAHALLAALP